MTDESRPVPRPLRVGLLGPFGGGNLGDAAIQQSMIEAIRRAHPRAEIVGISLDPGDTYRRHGIRSLAIGRGARGGWRHSAEADGEHGPPTDAMSRRGRRSAAGRARRALSELRGLLGAFRTLRRLDLLVVSGGGQLDDYWGGPWHHPYALFTWTALARLALVRVAMVSLGAGPISSRMSERLIRRALSFAHYRSFRDERSRALIARIGFDRGDAVVPDLAFGLKHAPAPRATGVRTVGVGPLPYLDGTDGHWPVDDPPRAEAYRRRLRELVGALVGAGYRVRLLPGEAHHDRRVIAELLEALRNEGVLPNGDQRATAPPIATAAELVSAIAGCDAIVSSRFHGVLLALMLGRPVVALSYHEKIDELMEAAGLGGYGLPIEGFTSEGVLARLARFDAEYEGVSASLLAYAARQRELVRGQYDAILCDVPPSGASDSRAG